MNIIFVHTIDLRNRSKLMKNTPLKRHTITSLVLFLFFPFVSLANSATNTAYRVKTIVIDAGHGGQDGATRGLFSREKDVALKVALRLGRTIEDNLKDVKVVYTRTTDEFVKLYERIEIANRAKADLFISIHCNDMPVISHTVISGYRKTKNKKRTPVYTTTRTKSTSTRGVETFVSGFGRLDEQDIAMRENASILLEKDYKENYAGYDPNDPESIIVLSLMKNAFRDQSIKFATMIQNEYVKTGRIDRGVQEKSLAVLARASMPAVLTEIGFISNPEEENYINSEKGQNEIVSCILNAIKTYKKQVEQE